MNLLNIREIVNIDMELHSPRFIIAEFGIASAIGVGVALFTFLDYPHTLLKWIMTLYFSGYALNCSAMWFIAWRDGGERKTKTDMTYQRLRRKSVEITGLLLVPAAVFALAIVQSSRRSNQRDKHPDSSA